MNTSPLDIEQHAALLEYLRNTGRIEAHASPRVQTLAGGVSNRTALLEFEDGRAWVLKQALAKLRVQVDWFSDPARIEREAAGLQAFGELAPARSVPALVFEDRAHHLLAMQAVPQPHDNYKTLLLAGDIQADHVLQFARLLGRVHRESSLKREVYARAFADRSFFETLRLEPYYTYAAQQVPAAEPFITALVAQTRARQIAIVHGDYSPKNVLIHHGKLVLLDFEVIHFGDPAFDVGFALTHYLSKAHHLPAHRRRLLEAAQLFWQYYGTPFDDATASAEHESACVAHMLGCMLARVRGRSPLEYLDTFERHRQCEIILALMQAPPTRIDLLIQQFAKKLSEYAND